MKENCRAALQRAYLFLDGEVLSVEERLTIQVHLEECRPCYERVGLEREITALVARLRTQQHCPGELKAKITSLLENDQGYSH